MFICGECILVLGETMQNDIFIQDYLLKKIIELKEENKLLKEICALLYMRE
jgi:hypothetical protein